ncbi:MAG: hypothetical protein Q7J31_10725 [Syntrophales bacterium]|nr:hypothetical protein [Syntrophales bacterium]
MVNENSLESKEKEQNEKWKFLSSHIAWLNQEKQIIWGRFSASITAVSIYFTGSLLAYKVSPLGAFMFSVLGLIICIIWLLQTIYGWKLLDKRLDFVSEIQSEISESSLKKWPLAFRPGIEQGMDWIKTQSVIIIVIFCLSFLVLAGISGATVLRITICPYIGP